MCNAAAALSRRFKLDSGIGLGNLIATFLLHASLRSYLLALHHSRCVLLRYEFDLPQWVEKSRVGVEQVVRIVQVPNLTMEAIVNSAPAFLISS
jgi:hypothetical protein